MSELTKYTSSIGKHISDFIAEKQSMGFKYAGESEIMRRFDRYWDEHGYADDFLTKDHLSDWLKIKEGENGSSLTCRISVIRQFSLYLNGLGIESYYPAYTVKYKPHARVPFSKEEISEFFAAVDRQKETEVTERKRFEDTYPVLFRTIYLNGLRISEACSLTINQLSFENNTITILDGKGHKDRLVYMSDDFSQMLKSYLCYISQTYGISSHYVFPGKYPERPIKPLSVNRKFNQLWSETSFANSREKPSVHDFRHTFVVERINRWMAQGLDFNHMLPYLCKYLGHRNFNETYYYYHYAEEAARTIREKDSVIDKVIPEVMRR